jgi:flagellar biosynthesis/type III secretory pathway chaperone
MSKALATAWTKAVKDPEKKKSLEELIRNSTTVLGQLKVLLEEEDKILSNSQLHAPDKDPSWALTMAHISGQRLQIKKTLDLLSFF